jgi:hypothetical protein
MSFSPTPWPRAFGFSLFVPIGEFEPFGGKAPCSGCADDLAVLFGDELEIPVDASRR